MSWLPSTRYQEVKSGEFSDQHDDSSERSLLDDSESWLLTPKTIGSRFESALQWRPPITAVVAMILATNALTIVFGSLYINYGNNLLRWTSGYTPIFDRVSIPTRHTELHIPLFPNASDPRDIFRLPPSPEVDAAWDRISNIGLHSVSAAELARLGKDPALAIHSPPDWWSDEWGSGYMVEIDAFHQIHCLNALRKGLVTNYQYYWGNRYNLTPPVTFAMHLNHCLGALLANLMCNADASVVTYNWRETQVAPFPDFAVNKKCRDFDALLAWQEKHKLKDAHRRWYAFEKPHDAMQREVPPGLTELGEGTGFLNGQPVQRLEGLPPQCI